MITCSAFLLESGFLRTHVLANQESFCILSSYYIQRVVSSAGHTKVEVEIIFVFIKSRLWGLLKLRLCDRAPISILAFHLGVCGDYFSKVSTLCFLRSCDILSHYLPLRNLACFQIYDISPLAWHKKLLRIKSGTHDTWYTFGWGLLKLRLCNRKGYIMFVDEAVKSSQKNNISSWRVWWPFL